MTTHKKVRYQYDMYYLVPRITTPGCNKVTEDDTYFNPIRKKMYTETSKLIKS